MNVGGIEGFEMKPILTLFGRECFVCAAIFGLAGIGFLIAALFCGAGIFYFGPHGVLPLRS